MLHEFNDEDMDALTAFFEGVSAKVAELQGILRARQFPDRMEALVLVTDDLEKLLWNLLHKEKR